VSTLPTIHEGDLVLYAAPTREALHAVFRHAYEVAKDRAAAAGQRVDRETGEVLDRRYFVAFGEAVDDVTLRQHRFYRGVVLAQIAEQAPGGWTRDAYHELFRREVLGSEQVRVQVAGRPRPTVYQRLRSTADLSVKQMSDFIDQVIALAVTTWGVEFRFDADEREAVRWRRKPRQARAEQREPEEAEA
jgi:hypothetical protein